MAKNSEPDANNFESDANNFESDANNSESDADDAPDLTVFDLSNGKQILRCKHDLNLPAISSFLLREDQIITHYRGKLFRALFWKLLWTSSQTIPVWKCQSNLAEIKIGRSKLLPLNRHHDNED